MKGNLCILAVLALIMPVPTFQQAPSCSNGYRDEDVTLAVEVSENTVTVAGVNFADLEQEFTAAFNVINSAQSRIGYFSTVHGYDHYPRAASTIRNYFNDKRRGAYLYEGLQKMNETYTQSSEPVHIAVVYSTSLFSSDIPLIVRDISSLQGKNYYVTLYAISKAVAVTDNFYDDLQTQLNSNFNRRVLYSLGNINNVAGLGNLILQNVLSCNDAPVVPVTTPAPTDREARCATCLSTQTSGHIYHESRCDMYLHCESVTEGDTTTTRITEKYCAPGTLFDQSLQVCAHADDVLAKSSDETKCYWCKGTNTGPYRYGDSCVAFYECTDANRDIASRCCPLNQRFDGFQCVNINSGDGCVYNRKHVHQYCRSYYVCNGAGDFVSECCPEGLGYNATTRQCDSVESCVDARCNDTRKYACHTVAVVGNECQYTDTRVEDSKAMDCAPGTVYSTADCMCVHAEPDSCPGQATPRNQLCTPTVLVDFEGVQKSPWGFKNNGRKEWERYIDLVDVTSINNADQPSGRDITLDGVKDYGHIRHYASNPYNNEAYLFSAKVQNEGTANKDMVIFSNKPCEGDMPASVLVTLNPSTRTVRYTIITSEGPVTKDLQYDSSYDNSWKEVSLRYDSTAGKMNVYLGILDNNGNQVTDYSDEADLKGTIVTSSCSLKFGGEGNDATSAFFEGQMDDIKIYDDCTSDQTPPANSA